MKDNDKKVFITSLGCPKNRVDSEIIAGGFLKHGIGITAEAKDSDIILINTCAFIGPAVEESIGAILEAAKLKTEKEGMKLVVSGCMVERYGKELLKELPEVDLFIRSADLADTVKLLRARQSPEISNSTTRGYIQGGNDDRILSTPPHRAYVKITEGCDNKCTYCLIPSLKGRLRSRGAQEILAEVKRLRAKGVVEITLVGQDLTAFGRDRDEENGLEQLLTDLVDSSDIPWIRLLYLYPDRLSDSLIELVAAEPRILPYFDIPLQHVSDRILQRMNRNYRREKIELLLNRIRTRIPDAAIRTTLMVGFPGEDESDYAELEAFLKKWCLDHVGVFAYCDEEGSTAANLTDKVNSDVATERRERLLALQAGIAEENLKKFIGRELEVLVEGVSRESDLLLEGRSRYQGADIDGLVYINAGNCRAGDLVKVKIEETHTYDLVGGLTSD